MSAARILHFGDDACHRLTVLEQAGYQASVCRTGRELVQRVREDGLDAVLFPRLPAVRLRVDELRRETRVPFVLWSAEEDVIRAGTFDLVVDPITDPRIWLRKLEETIRRSREIRERSALILGQSQALRSESEILRRESEAVRRESAEEAAKLRLTRKFPGPKK